MNITDWPGITALVVAAIGAVGTIILQGLQMYFTYKRATTIEKKVDTGVEKAKEAAEKAQAVEEKIDDNTKITKEGTQAAASAATQAASKAEEIADNLDGKIEQKITTIVKAHTEPLLAVFKMHIQQNDSNINGLDAKFAEMSRYVHERNHDMLNLLQVQANKTEALLVIVRQQSQQAARPDQKGASSEGGAK